MASPQPTTIAVRTRGRRRSITIASAVGAQVIPRSMPRIRSARIATVVDGARSTVPSTIPPIRTTNRVTTPATASQPALPRRVGTTVAARCRIGAGAGTGAEVIAGSRSRQDQVRVDRQSERADPLAQAGARAGDDDVVDRADGVVLDRGQHVPARPLRDLVRGHA